MWTLNYFCKSKNLIFFSGLQQETSNYGRSTPWDSVTDFTNSLARQFSMEECGEMAICTAHANYRDYGLMALPLILIFPG